MRPAKKSTLLIIAAFVLVIAVIIVITACKSPVGADLDKNKNGGGNQLPDTAGGDTRLLVTSYLFDNPDDMNFDAGLFGGLPAAYMSGSYFSESTKNPWREENIFTLTRDTEGQEFTITFPQRMNIKMAHENFTNNNPVISWNSYPGASGYFVMVIVQERNENPNKDTFSGSDLWEVAFYGYTRDANITVFSERITFDTVYTSEAAIEAQIKQGDFIRVEVYALDGFGTLDTKTKKGVLAMDSVNIIR